ncbi:MAG: RNA polymerase sigma factor [Clostridiales bacterium]|nr:RNA polymerase sigma factor [Clostridiales bacterium]
MKGGADVAQDAREKLYETYYMRVFSYAMTLSGNREQAEELTQETFFRAFARQSAFRGEADEATWLCAIAKNLFVDGRRRESRQAPMPEDLPDTAGSIEQRAADRDSSFRIHMALHALEEPYREVFELRIFGELSFRDVGAIFGKTENWARVTYHRARLKLRERMEEK